LINIVKQVIRINIILPKINKYSKRIAIYKMIVIHLINNINNKEDIPFTMNIFMLR